MVPTCTGKPGKWENVCSQGIVRQFLTDWKSQGILPKIWGKLGNFSQCLFFSDFLIEVLFV